MPGTMRYLVVWFGPSFVLIPLPYPLGSPILDHSTTFALPAQFWNFLGLGGLNTVALPAQFENFTKSPFRISNLYLIHDGLDRPETTTWGY